MILFKMSHKQFLYKCQFAFLFSLSTKIAKQNGFTDRDHVSCDFKNGITCQNGGSYLLELQWNYNISHRADLTVILELTVFPVISEAWQFFIMPNHTNYSLKTMFSDASFPANPKDGLSIQTPH